MSKYKVLIKTVHGYDKVTVTAVDVSDMYNKVSARVDFVRVINYKKK